MKYLIKKKDQVAKIARKQFDTQLRESLFRLLCTQNISRTLGKQLDKQLLWPLFDPLYKQQYSQLYRQFDLRLWNKIYTNII